jgi:hypothetical protein
MELPFCHVHAYLFREDLDEKRLRRTIAEQNIDPTSLGPKADSMVFDGSDLASVW